MAKRAPRTSKRTAAELRALVNDPEVFAAVEYEQKRRTRISDLKRLRKLAVDVKAGRASAIELMVHQAVCQLRYSNGYGDDVIGPTAGSA
jgi:hypothetical protein